MDYLTVDIQSLFSSKKNLDAYLGDLTRETEGHSERLRQRILQVSQNYKAMQDIIGRRGIFPFQALINM